jgi:signal transduction histidine kinase
LGKIFEPLYTSKKEGLGLGLALSQSFAEANGGIILVESKEGRGSTFIIRFGD